MSSAFERRRDRRARAEKGVLTRAWEFVFGAPPPPPAEVLREEAQLLARVQWELGRAIARSRQASADAQTQAYRAMARSFTQLEVRQLLRRLHTQDRITAQLLAHQTSLAELGERAARDGALLQERESQARIMRAVMAAAARPHLIQFEALMQQYDKASQIVAQQQEVFQENVRDQDLDADGELDREVDDHFDLMYQELQATMPAAQRALMQSETVKRRARADDKALDRELDILAFDK